MSKSYKKTPIGKANGFMKKEYSKIIRRVQNQFIRDIINLIDKESYEIPDSKSIVNDYNYIDYWWIVDEPKYYRK